MSRPQLNADQAAAVKAISAFLVGPHKEFFLTGGPGVGKTFTTRELADILPTVYRNYLKAMAKTGNPLDLALTSTTNKAAAVLAEQTGHPTSTIHSFLGVIPKVDYESGQTLLKKTNKWMVHSDILLFVDEASMIEQNLYNLINEATDSSCKIIYIGDKNQLPPVMEKLSPAVGLSDYKDRHYEISTPVRNAGAPALMDLCQRLKEDILIEQAKPNLTHWKEVPGEIEHVSGAQLQVLIDGLYGPGGPIKPDDEELQCRILAYTNKTVIGYNNYIRELRGLPDHPIEGEILISNTHFQLSKVAAVNVEEEVHIHGVEGPITKEIDEHNSIQAYKILMSTASSGRHYVLVPAVRDEFLNLKSHYKKHRQWRMFYRLDEIFMDLRNREAATVYKAQGSTYDSVILIMSDIFTVRDINQLRRMLYVGASRARKKVYVYDKGIHENERGIY